MQSVQQLHASALLPLPLRRPFCQPQSLLSQPLPSPLSPRPVPLSLLAKTLSVMPRSWQPPPSAAEQPPLAPPSPPGHAPRPPSVQPLQQLHASALLPLPLRRASYRHQSLHLWPASPPRSPLPSPPVPLSQLVPWPRQPPPPAAEQPPLSPPGHAHRPPSVQPLHQLHASALLPLPLRRAFFQHQSVLSQPLPSPLSPRPVPLSLLAKTFAASPRSWQPPPSAASQPPPPPPGHASRPPSVQPLQQLHAYALLPLPLRRPFSRHQSVHLWSASVLSQPLPLPLSPRPWPRQPPL